MPWTSRRSSLSAISARSPAFANCMGSHVSAVVTPHKDCSSDATTYRLHAPHWMDLQLNVSDALSILGLAMTFRIDPQRTTLGFSVKHMMIATVRGSFPEYDAELEV